MRRPWPPPPPGWRQWRHVTKLDPDRALSDSALRLVLESGTDALLVGGTQGVTGARVQGLLDRLQDCSLPIALEVTAAEACLPGFDLYLVPAVLNSADVGWLVGRQARVMQEVLGRYGALIPWDLLLCEPYIILNRDAAAAALTGAETDLDAAAVAGYAAVACRLWRLPLLYLEYSGAYGDPVTVAAARSQAGEARLWYGGGIDGAARAAEMAQLADTIVVGNLVYQAPGRLRETAESARSVRTIHARTRNWEGRA